MVRRSPSKKASRANRGSAITHNPSLESSDLVRNEPQENSAEAPDHVLLSRAERFALLEAQRLLEPLVGKDAFQDVEGFFARLVAIDAGANDPHTVKVRVSKKRAPDLKKDPWFASLFAWPSGIPAGPETKGGVVSSLEAQPDGSVLLSFQAVNLPAVARWVRLWGIDVLVLEPSQLVAMVQRQVTRAKPRPKGGRVRARHKDKPHR